MNQDIQNQNKSTILYNPESGSGKSAKYAGILLNRLKESNHSVKIVETDSAEDVIEEAAQSCNGNRDYLFIIGGDGTVNLAFEGLGRHEERPILGIIPGGTGNMIAGLTGFTNMPEYRIRYLDLDRYGPFDVGKVNDRYFGYMFSFGTIPQLIDQTPSEAKSRMGLFAYAQNLLPTGLNFSSHNLRLTVGDKVVEDSFTHGIISTTTRIKRFYYADGANEANDGLFNVFLTGQYEPMEVMRLAAHALVGEANKYEKVVYFTTDSIRIEAVDGEEEVHTDIDGERGPSLPVDITIQPSFVNILGI